MPARVPILALAVGIAEGCGTYSIYIAISLMELAGGSLCNTR